MIKLIVNATFRHAKKQQSDPGLTSLVGNGAVSARNHVAAVFHANIADQPVVFLTELEKFLKIKPAIAIVVMPVEDGFGQSFRQIVALAGIFFKHSLDLAFLQISVSVRVVLKATIFSSDRDSLKKGHKMPHLVENPTDALTLRALLSRSIINLR